VRPNAFALYRRQRLDRKLFQLNFLNIKIVMDEKLWTKNASPVTYVQPV
jgi:hypothetical protein